MLNGSDVSEYQAPGTVPRPDDAFWYIRVADPATKRLDKTWAAHLAVAQARGLTHGAYLFDRFSADPVKEADLLASVSKPGMLPPALDVESFTLPPVEAAVHVDAVLARLRAQGFARVTGYMSRGNVDRVAWDQVRHLGMIGWWLADWGATMVPPTVHGRPVWFHQTANRGGAGGGDADRFLGDRAQLDGLLIPKPSPGYEAVLVLGLWRHKQLRDRALNLLPAGERVHAAPVRVQGRFGIRLLYGPWRDEGVARQALSILRDKYSPHASGLRAA